MLLSKSQLPDVKREKTEAIQALLDTLSANHGKLFTDKQAQKRIANMKAAVKKKSDANSTGNRKILLNEWEDDLFNVMNGEDNPSVTKMASSVSFGLSATLSASTSEQSEITSPRPKKCKQTTLSVETDETRQLTTSQLQRLVLLEQLHYTREKRRVLHEQQAMQRLSYN